MERKYYQINEETARAAKEMNSFTPLQRRRSNGRIPPPLQ